MRQYEIRALYPDGIWRTVGTTETIASPARALHHWKVGYRKDCGPLPAIWTKLQAVQIS